MLDVFEQLASSTANERFPRSRIVCHMNWAVEAGTHVDNLVEFKSPIFTLIIFSL
jgi:hypothetical protein